MSEIVPSIDRGSNFGEFVSSLQTKFEPVPGCKLCASKFRKEAESMSERGRSVAAIHRFLSEENKEEISYSAVKNHITYHFHKEEDALTLKEFAAKLGKWSKLNRDDIALFGRYIEFFDMEAMELASQNKGLTLGERRKNDELIIKLGQMFIAYKEQLRKVNAEMKPIEVIITSLNRIIKVKLEGSANPEVKRVLSDIIDQLLKEVGDMPIDQKGDDE